MSKTVFNWGKCMRKNNQNSKFSKEHISAESLIKGDLVTNEEEIEKIIISPKEHSETD